MTEDKHQRAERLILEARMAEIPEADRFWLEKHIEDCPDCAARADSIERAIRSLRSMPIELDPAFVAATRYRIHQRANELRQTPSSRLLFWLASVLSITWMIASTPYIWRGLEWVSNLLGIPRLVWQMGFGLWWLLPALALAALLSELSSGRNEQEGASIPLQHLK